MSYESTSAKLKKYKSGFVKGECRRSEYEAQVKQEKSLNEKLDLADTMFNEVTFHFNKEYVKDLIKTFPNFNELHRQARNEEIILSMIFYARALETKELKITPKLVKKFVNPKKQKNYPKLCELICWRITLYYVQKQPILPREPKGIDHNILYKG